MKLGSNRAEIHSIYTCLDSELYEEFKFNIICDQIRSSKVVVGQTWAKMGQNDQITTKSGQYVSTQNLVENSN